MSLDFLRQLADHAAQPDGAFQLILNSFPEGILVFDAERKLIFANSMARAAFLPGGSTVGGGLDRLREVFRLLDPETGNPIPENQGPLEQALRGEWIVRKEYMLNRTSGNRFWIEISGQPVRASTGEVDAAILTFQGISDRKKREIELRAAAKLHDLLYRENLAGIAQVTLDGRILDCNEAYVRMLGYASKQDVLAIHARQLYWDPSERERILRLLSTTSRLSRYESCYRRLDGSRCWVLINARLVNDPTSGFGDTIVSTIVDITDRKVQEETLRQSEQRFSTFMQHLPGVAFIKDLTGKFVYHNDSSIRLFNRKPEEIVGKTDAELWGPEESVRYHESDATVIHSGKPGEFVEKIMQTDGAHTWLVYKFPIVENDKVALVAGIGIDITERTVMQQQLTQVNKMEALGRMAGGVAHDFNNLLTVISGYGQLAIESIGTVPIEHLTTYLREILDSARRASGLTTQLLAFSRRQLVQPKLLDLCDLLRGMQTLLQRVIGEHVELTVRCGEEPCLIHVDANQMEQAIMNLAVNSRDAMPLGGQLDLHCRIVPQPVSGALPQPVSTALPHVGNAERVVLLEVADTGIGMEEHVRSQIFDPFFTSKDQGKGTGLGLSTVYGATSQANGRIEVDSKPGEGTVFRLYFPLAEDGKPEQTAAPKPAPAPRGQETVLLVEDEQGVRMLVETILKRLGYKVLVAESGPAALQVWHENGGAVNVLLTDVIMPQMSGGELAHQLRALQPHLRVLFMSGYTDDMIASHGVLAGETQLIQKPFTAEALGRKLRGVLDA